MSFDQQNSDRKEPAMPATTSHRKTFAAAVASAALIGAGSVAGLYAAFGPDGGATIVRQVTVGSAQPTARGTGSTVGDIYKSSYKSVVEITVDSQAQANPLGGGGGTQQAQGSGFVYDAQGHVITNEHVVDGANSVSVQLWNGKSYTATVIGSDPSTDVAVIKIDAPAAVLAPLALGDSSTLQVGDGVVAIGSPFGLEQTVTTGIVSALHRQITAPNNFAIDDAIQTDAAINHGNSGGPLLDLNGKVIGVNSQIESDSGGNDGIGFAVPSSTVKRIADGLIANGSVEHAYLGVATDDTSDGSGARISEVRPSTPAAGAGLKSGDVVTKVGDASITTADELRRAIDSKQPGDQVELTVRRNGTTQTLQVSLTSRPTA
jgi:putative serine protease PepD